MPEGRRERASTFGLASDGHVVKCSLSLQVGAGGEAIGPYPYGIGALVVLGVTQLVLLQRVSLLKTVAAVGTVVELGTDVAGLWWWVGAVGA